MQLTEGHLFDRVWLHLCEQLENMTNTRYQDNDNNRVELNQLVHKRIEILRARIVKTDRNRRGLFNFVGDIASSLFGIPSANDLQRLKVVNEKLVRAVEGVVVRQGNIVAKVNVLGRKQQEIMEKVNEVINRQREQFEFLNSRLIATTYLIRTTLRILRINTLIDIIIEDLRQYEETLALIQAMRISCESRTVTEQLIPTKMAEEILTSGLNHQKIDPLTYYAYIQVRKITEIEGKVYCVLRAPLFTDDKQAQMAVTTVPTCTPGKCLKLYQPEPFVMSYTTEELYYPTECFGPKPKACRPGVKYDKRQLPCLHGLINGDPTQQTQCPITIYKNKPPPQPIATVTLNRYVVSTEVTLYHYRCPQKTPRTGTLPLGSYVIDVEPNCIFDTMNWMLQGIPIQDIEYNRTILPPKQINLTWLKIEELPLGNHTTLLPVGIKQLTLPNYEALQKPPEIDITRNINKIQSEIGRTHWLVWLLMSITLIIGLFTVGCYIKMKYCTKARKPVTTKAIEREVAGENERNTVSVQVDMPEDSDEIESC